MCRVKGGKTDLLVDKYFLKLEFLPESEETLANKTSVTAPTLAGSSLINSSCKCELWSFRKKVWCGGDPTNNGGSRPRQGGEATVKIEGHQTPTIYRFFCLKYMHTNHHHSNRDIKTLSAKINGFFIIIFHLKVQCQKLLNK